MIPVVLAKHFHLAEKRQSPGPEEILLVVHWAEDRNKSKIGNAGDEVYTTVVCFC